MLRERDEGEVNHYPRAGLDEDGGINCLPVSVRRHAISTHFHYWYKSPLRDGDGALPPVSYTHLTLPTTPYV